MINYKGRWPLAIITRLYGIPGPFTQSFSSLASKVLKRDSLISRRQEQPSRPTDQTAVPKLLPISQALQKINTQNIKLYAKLLIHNFPFTVVPTDLIITHRIKDVQVGDTINLTRIMEVGSPDYKLRGLPVLPNGAVTVRATVMEHSEGAKKRAKMKKQRKGRRPLKTIKPHITTLRIQGIQIDPQFADPSKGNDKDNTI